MGSNLYQVISGIINNERGIITGLQSVKGTADRLDGVIVTSGDGTSFLADNGTYVNVGSNNLAPVVNGKIPAEFLPSYVDDVIEGYYRSNAFYATASGGSPMTGEAGKLYLDLTNNKNELYRWTGSAYVKVSGLSGDDLLAINNKITYVSGVVSGIHVYNSTITLNNSVNSKNAATFTVNESGNKTVQVSALFDGYARGTIGSANITLKNSVNNKSASSFSANESSAKTVELSGLFDGYTRTTVNNKTVTFKNGSTTLGTLSTNQSANSEIQLSSMLDGIATNANIPTVNNVTISFKNGALTAADTFTTNASSAKAIQLSGILSGLAPKSSIPTVNNKTVTFKNGSTTIGTLSTNQSANSEINLSAEFNKKQDVIDSSHKLDYSLISSQPTIPSVGNATITFKNGSTSLGSFTTNQSSAGTIQLSSLVTTANGAIGDGTITLKNGSTSIGSFTVNQSDAKEINLSAQFNAKQNSITSTAKLDYSLLSGTPTIPAAAGAGVITLSNSINNKSATTFTANESSAKTVQVSALFDGYARGTIGNGTITIKNGTATGDTFTANETGAKSVQLSTLWSGYAKSSEIKNSTITIKNGSTSIGSFTLNAASDATINLSAEFNKKQNSITSTAKLDYGLLSGTPTIPAAAGAGAITLKNSVNSASATSFSANESSAKTIELSGLFAGYSRATVGTASITLKNSVNNKSATSFSVNETSNKTIEMSGLFDNYAKADKVEADLGFLSGQIDGLNAQSNPEGTIAAFAAISGNLVTAAAVMSANYFVTATANGAKTVEGKTLTKTASVGSSSTDNQIPTAKAVYTEVNKKQNSITSTAKLDYSLLSGTPTIPSVGNGTISFKNGSVTAADTFTTNQSGAKAVELSALFDGYAKGTIGAANITLSNSVNSKSADVFSVNETTNKTINLSALFTGYSRTTVNNKTVTFKNGSTVLGTLSTNQSANSEIQLSSMVGNGTISFKNGTTAATDTFTLNQSSDKAVQLSGLFDGYAKSSEIKNSTITLKNGGTTIDSFTLNASSNKDIQLSSLVTQAPNVGAAVITLKNGTKTGETFNVNETTDKTVQLSALFSGYATGTIGAGAITLKNSINSKSASSFSANESSAKTVELSGLFDGYVRSDGTGNTSGKVVVTTTTGNKILSSDITAANIVTAASNMSSGKIVTANGNKTIEGATLTKVTTITSGRTDNDIPTAAAVYAYTSGAVNKVSANNVTITIKDTQANISDNFTTNASSAKTIELSGMFAKRECLSAVFPTGTTPTVTANQWAILTASATSGITLGTGTSGAFIKVTVTSAAINGTQVNISGTITGQDGTTWGSIATTANPLKVDIPETLTFVHNGSAWLLVESSRL